LERIERDIERLDALIGDTLQLSRLSEAEPTFARETLELGHLVSEVVEDAYFETSAEGKSIRPEKISNLSAVGNFELLRRAIHNVIRNAIRFAPVGTTVEVSARVDNGVPIVAVRDRDRACRSAISIVSSRHFIVSSKRENAPPAASVLVWRLPLESWRCTAAAQEPKTRPTADSLSSFFSDGWGHTTGSRSVIFGASIL
jgi:signal transduction histidine kinase